MQLGPLTTALTLSQGGQRSELHQGLKTILLRYIDGISSSPRPSLLRNLSTKSSSSASSITCQWLPGSSSYYSQRYFHKYQIAMYFLHTLSMSFSFRYTTSHRSTMPLIRRAGPRSRWCILFTLRLTPSTATGCTNNKMVTFTKLNGLFT